MLDTVEWFRKLQTNTLQAEPQHDSGNVRLSYFLKNVLDTVEWSQNLQTNTL